MLAIWSLVLLPFINLACTSGSSQLYSLLVNEFEIKHANLENVTYRSLDHINPNSQNPRMWGQNSRWPSAAAAAKLLQSCPTLCDPIDGSPPGSTVPGILQARTLEWVAISFSNA